MLLRLGARVARLFAMGFRLGDGIQKRHALLHDFLGNRLGLDQFGVEFVMAAGEFGDLLRGGGAARIPARGISANCRQALFAHFAFAPDAIQRGAGFAAGQARGRGAAARFGGLAIERVAIGHFLQEIFGLAARLPRAFDRLFQAADFGFHVGQFRGALGMGAGGAGAFVLRRDQRLFTLAFLVLGLRVRPGAPHWRRPWPGNKP